MSFPGSAEADTGLEIAIVGASLRVPGAGDIDTFWLNLCGGIESISRFDESSLDVSTLDAIEAGDPAHVKAGGVLDGIELFDAVFFGITPREAQITDPQHRLFLECAWEAIESSGYDAAAYPGAIGVYASAGSNTYLLNNLCSNSDLLAAVGSLQIAIGNEKDYLATRTSYKLDLRGPSMSVQSACSSSLLAVHIACQALLNGECDMALAGGVSIAVPQKTGYRYHQGGIGSPDGHCRAFDAQAQGTVKGNGVGVVLLKRLVDATDDGDTIVAVIKGSATNNDGSGKVSYTAPSGVGQADAIAAAQTIAGVDSATIGFVEAHGTGTALGDPIEIAALTMAFGAQGVGDERCLVGSVKSNVGHLDAAAGIAGLLKAALAVKHGQIPATVHYTRANPNIDFETSPFAVNAAIARWPKRDGPRRAGVSSFGIGGTNVHVILEEAPVAPSGIAPSGDQLVLLSARTPAALDAMSDRLAAHLVARPDLSLADVAYTLQVGRKAFDHRRALVGSTTAEIATALATRPARRIHTASKSAAPRPVAFLFPGQGAQHVRMAAGLYADEPRFAAPFRACAEMLAPHLGMNLCDVLYGGGGADEDAAVALRRTALAQPALFAVDYALAHLWSEWGVEPRAMIGHSVGEYVAACRAGVFALEDALALVAFRGTLMQQCPEGAMLAVPLPEDEVRTVLDADCSLAAVNRRSLCVVSGPNAAIDALARRLTARDIVARRLDVSHAFHSPMMDPILDAFVAAVDKITLRTPSMPFLSNVSGTWITDDEATDPRYWARQLRRPVQFAASVDTLLAEGDWAFLEVGPGAALGNAVRSFIADRPECVVSSSLPVAGTDRSDLSFLQDAAGRLWCHGVDIRRDRLSFETRRRVPLPTYPFERRRHWIDARAPATSDIAAVAFDEADEVDASAPSDICDLLATASLSDKEAVVAALWRDILGVDTIDASSNFFELGGDSIAGLQMTFQARQRGLHVGLAQLLDHPTVAALAAVAVRVTEAVVDDGPSDGDGALPVIVARPADRGEPFPLTAVQQAYWIGRSGARELGSVAAHVYQEYQSADLDLGRLERALDVLIRRHEALRSMTTADGRQRILMDVPHYRIAIHDLQGASVETVETARAALRERMSHQVLPSERWPLFEVVASRSDDDFRLHLSIDILFTDAWSLVLLGRELLDLYRDPTRVLAPLDLSFRDYVLAEIAMRDGNLYQQSQRYWMARLDDLPPAPALPPAVRDRAAGTPRFVRRSGRLDADCWTAIKRHAGRIGLTPSTVLCAAYAEILAVWSASPRFCLNLPLFNRLPLHSDVNRILGDFTSVVLLEVDVGDDDGFEQHALRLQSRLWSDLDHRHFSGVDVIRELGRLDASRAQMPVVFTSLILPGAQDSSADAVATLGEAIFSISQTPQVHLDHQVAEDGDGLVFNWDAVEDAFPPGLIADMFDAYCRFLCALASDDVAAWRGSARRRVSLPAAQIEAWAAFNATEGARSSALLHTGFFRQALDAPGRVALITPTRTLRYGELASCSWRIAQRLRDFGCGRGMLVAVVMDKGWEQVAAVLATLLVEGVYVPIDASFPTDYLHQVLTDAQVGMILTQPWLDMTLVWPETIPRLALRDDDLVDETMRSEHAPIATPGSPDDLAYIIYTSGTTGTPKGVMIDHRGAVNTILDVNARFGIGPDDRVFALSALNFDLSVYDLFGTLAAGAAIVLPAATGTRDPVHWAQMMRQAGVTVWNSVPALMEMLVHAVDGREADALMRLRLVLLSGDWIPVRLPERIAALAPNARLVSLGGATEASIWSILYDITTVDPAWTSIPYGRPMLNQRILVLDDTFEPRPIHVPGALFIGGAGLAKGYWHNADETDARFVRHPVTGERLYRTGDLGRLLPDGTIEFLGREDFQVKIQGYRIELGEIEAALCRHPAVEAAAVVAATTPGGGKRLIAYVVVRRGQSVAAAALREAARERLPDYMVPSLVVMLDALPMTPNGKIDRRALPAPHEDAPIDILVAPRTATERRLSTIWCQILDQSAVGIDRNFFEIGGDSLLATKMMVAIQGAFDQEVPLRTIFDLATIEALAAHLDRLVDPSACDTIRPIARVGRDRPLPVSASQGRLWFNDRLDAGNATYNFPVALRLTGPLRVDILERCLEEIVRRHEVLRTAFAVVDGIPVQIVAAEQPVRVVQDHVERFDVQGQATTIRSALAEESLFAFDLTRGPMFRARLLVLSDEVRVLIMTMHHIITDAWSMAILVDEIASLYEAFGEGRPSPLAPLPIQYADYAAWERETVDGGALRSQAAYWKTVLDGPIPRLSLPEDHPEATAVPNNGARVAFVIEEGTLTGLRALCRDEGITLFMVLMASWQLLLYAYSREPDIRVGTPTANRDQPDVERLIGVFVNTLVLQTHVEPTARVVDILRQVRESALGAFANQRLPFDKVVEDYWRDRRGVERTPLFRTWFVLQNVPIATPRLGDILVTPMDAHSLMAVHPLKLSIVEQADALECAIDFRTHLFETATIERMRELFEHLLDMIVADPMAHVGVLAYRLSNREAELRDADERDHARAREAALGRTRRRQIPSSLPSG